MNDRIAYQNKDIISKTFMEEFRGKSLDVYGVHLPRIVRLLPTNLPAFEANELRIDNLLELADGTLAIIDYESEYNEEDKLKYLGYMMRVCKRQFKEGKGNADIRMVVIYDSPVKSPFSGTRYNFHRLHHNILVRCRCIPAGQTSCLDIVV